MSENRQGQSGIVSALYRLERAGSEHSASTQKLIRAAGTLGSAIAKLVPKAVWDEDNRFLPELPRGYRRAGNGIAYLERNTYGEELSVYVDDDRDSALRFARDIADGWLDELAAWLEQRSGEDAAAVATLERAAAGLRGEVTQ